jgi:hypothetical protein
MAFTHSDTLARYARTARGISIGIELDRISDHDTRGMLGYRARAVIGGECRQSYDAATWRGALRLAVQDARDDPEGVFG